MTVKFITCHINIHVNEKITVTNASIDMMKFVF